jgi:hypothetical protein
LLLSFISPRMALSSGCMLSNILYKYSVLTSQGTYIKAFAV